MSLQDSPTLDLDVRSRRTESRVVLLTLALASMAPALLPIDLWAQALLIVSSGIVIAVGFWQAGWWGSRRVQRMVWRSDGRWLVMRRSGPPLEVNLLPQSRRGPGCVWLRWQQLAVSRFSRRSRYAMLLCNGDLATAEWRRLRVRLAVAPSGPPLLNWLEGPDESAHASSDPLKFGECLRRYGMWRALVRRCSVAPLRGAAVAGTNREYQAGASRQVAR